MSLTREQILSANDQKLEVVSVPEWGGDVHIRVMNGMERDAYEEWAGKADRSLVGVRGRLAALCIVDEKGVRLFTDDDIAALGCKAASALERVVSAAMRLNAVSNRDIEELTKN